RGACGYRQRVSPERISSGNRPGGGGDRSLRVVGSAGSRERRGVPIRKIPRHDGDHGSLHQGGTRYSDRQAVKGEGKLRVLIAPDSFKGSMSSLEAGDRMAAGLRASFSSMEVEQALLADGGEGTVDALIRACGGEKVFRRGAGPLGGPVGAGYGLRPEARAVAAVAASW